MGADGFWTGRYCAGLVSISFGLHTPMANCLHNVSPRLTLHFRCPPWPGAEKKQSQKELGLGGSHRSDSVSPPACPTNACTRCPPPAWPLANPSSASALQLRWDLFWKLAWFVLLISVLEPEYSVDLFWEVEKWNEILLLRTEGSMRWMTVTPCVQNPGNLKLSL